MTEQTYNPKEYALELGFSEEDAERLGSNYTNATNIRRIEKGLREKGLMPDQKGKPDVVPQKTEVVSETKEHKHYYRKDGTCACGAVKGDRAGNAALAAKIAVGEAEAIAKAAAEAKAEAAKTPEPPADVVETS